MKAEIGRLSQERHEILSKEEEVTEENNLKADDLENKISNLIDEHKDQLPFEFILETLAGMGYAPMVLYDDCGHWAVYEGDSSSLPYKKGEKDWTDDVQLLSYVEKEHWKGSTREALNHYLKRILSEDETQIPH
jgi:hypothetical protein